MQYRARTRQLVSRCRAELGLDEETALTPAAFVEWLVGRRAELGRSSWRSYKAASLWALTQAPDEHWPGVDTIALHEAAAALGCEPQTGALRRTGRTSGGKLKRLRPGDMAALERHFASSRSQYATWITVLLRAGVATGLRPCEWFAARRSELEEGYAFTLVVRNAKGTQGRSHGPARTLRWRWIGPAAQHAITTLLALVASLATTPEPDAQGQYDEVLKSCRDELARVCRVLWPRRRRHVTLYSARHEAACRLKLLYEPHEVAALMGHAVDETAYRHYARILASRGGRQVDLSGCPEPHPTDVGRVRRTGWKTWLEQVHSLNAHNKLA